MRNPPKSGKATISSGKQSTRRRRHVVPSTSSGYSHRTTPKNEVKHEGEAKSLENTLLENAVELVKSNGYKVTQNAPADINLVFSKCIEVPDNRYILDIAPLMFHHRGGSVRYNNENGCLQVRESETDGVNELCNKLVEATQKITSILLKWENHGEGNATRSCRPFLEGLEGYSANLLLSRINYFKLHGKSVRFWVNPVLLVSSRLEDQTGESTSWIPIPAKPAKCGIDVINTANLASYLDFREREVKNIGGQLATSQEDLGIFPKALRLFRILTVCAAMTLLGGFFILALGKSNNSLTPVFALGLATLIEALGGQRLLKGYHSIHKYNTIIQARSPMITPEQLAKIEEEFLPDERMFLYWKYGGTDQLNLRNEARCQRIEDLVSKSREILSRTGKLENDGLFSEAVLSCDRAIRTALSAILLSIGVEPQGNDIETWFPHLRRTLQNMKLEDIRCLRQLRDRINRGYDASREEAQRAKQISMPVVGDALHYLTAHRRDGNAHSPTVVDDHLTETVEDLEPRIHDQMLTSKTRARKRGVKPIGVLETTRVMSATAVPSAKFSDELDKITKSLTETWTDTEESKDKDSDMLKWAPDENSPIPQVLLFESLGDFRRITSRRKSPIVASFLSDDNPSKEVKSAMDGLVTKYHKKAAFIYVTSKSQDIARECKIKSYPTVLVLHKGRVATELKSLSLEQLDLDLEKMLGASAPANNGEDREKKPLLPNNEEDNSAETDRDNEMRRLEVTHSL
jgi:hypothetical protein